MRRLTRLLRMFTFAALAFAGAAGCVSTIIAGKFALALAFIVFIAMAAVLAAPLRIPSQPSAVAPRPGRKSHATIAAIGTLIRQTLDGLPPVISAASGTTQKDPAPSQPQVVYRAPNEKTVVVDEPKQRLLNARKTRKKPSSAELPAKYRTLECQFVGEEQALGISDSDGRRIRRSAYAKTHKIKSLPREGRYPPNIHPRVLAMQIEFGKRIREYASTPPVRDNLFCREAAELFLAFEQNPSNQVSRLKVEHLVQRGFTYDERFVWYLRRCSHNTNQICALLGLQPHDVETAVREVTDTIRRVDEQSQLIRQLNRASSPESSAEGIISGACTGLFLGIESARAQGAY